MQCIWTCVLCISGSYGQLLDYIIFAVLVFYILTIAGLFVLRVKRPNEPRPYRAIGYPVLPAVYILMAVFIDVVLLRYKPQYTWPGLIIVLLGIPVYFVWSRRGQRSDCKSLISRRDKLNGESVLKCKPLDMLMEEASDTGEHSLKRALGPVNLITLGIGAIIGAGIFVLTGSAAAQYAGPAIVLSFILAGSGCVFAGLCYSEFASLIPDCRLRLHLRLRHAGRNFRLDHRLGPGSGICLRRCHRGFRLERLLRQPAAGFRHSYTAAAGRDAIHSRGQSLGAERAGAVPGTLGTADHHGARC